MAPDWYKTATRLEARLRGDWGVERDPDAAGRAEGAAAALCWRRRWGGPRLGRVEACHAPLLCLPQLRCNPRSEILPSDPLPATGTKHMLANSTCDKKLPLKRGSWYVVCVGEACSVKHRLWCICGHGILSLPVLLGCRDAHGLPHDGCALFLALGNRSRVALVGGRLP